MKRAHGEEQKSQRREEILLHTRDMLHHKDFNELTLSTVAQSLDLVKGTLYRYFPTKESLVLEVLEREMHQWLCYLRETLTPEAYPSPLSLSRILSSSLSCQPLMIKLFSIVHVTLEKNLSLERLISFKKQTVLALKESGSLIEGACPALKDRGVEAVLTLYELAIGIGHLTQRSPLVSQALKTPGLEVFNFDFQSQLEKSLGWTLLGLATPSF